MEGFVRKIDAEAFLELAGGHVIVDVRSPGEFKEGHIPSAVNIPLFTDDERAVIGTLYQKQGREQATLKGLDFALPKVFDYLSSLEKIAKGKTICLHCWRGGLRSEMMAEVFSQAGYQVYLLEGGYKAYRRFIRDSFSVPAKIIVLGGYTGCGKTDVLKSLARIGEQIIDLESLASHKGSVFGALGQGHQPTNEQFENELYNTWSKMDLSRRIWLEDESRSIGRVALPPPVYEHISNGRMVKVILDKKLRISRLVDEYAVFDKELIAAALLRIREGLGGTRYKLAMEALGRDDFALVADLVLEYYDKAYQKSIDKRPCKEILDIELKGPDPSLHTKAILEILKKNNDE
ncbi:MAG: tRNA 2-selenouridine(34) synthase MnmH [Bacteroidota bacterium]|jgi:tRNA 2-selenouridine synthase